MEDFGGLECCAIAELSDFPYDANDMLTKEWLDELPGDLLAYRNKPCLVALNSEQLKAKKILEKARFKVILTCCSEEDGKPIYLLARGFTAPRIKRGKVNAKISKH